MRKLIFFLVLLALPLHAAQDDQERAITVKEDGVFKGAKTLILNGKLYVQEYGETKPVKAEGKPRTIYIDGTPYLLHTSGRVDRLMLTKDKELKPNERISQPAQAEKLMVDGKEYVVVNGKAMLLTPENSNETNKGRGMEFKDNGTVSVENTKEEQPQEQPRELPPQKVGKAFIKTEPSGAEIFKGNINVGKTPCMIELGVGTQILVAKLAGCEDKIFEVEIRDTSIHKPPVVTLEPSLLSVDVLASKEWPIYVDGQPYKEGEKHLKAPATVKVKAGQHKIEIREGDQSIAKDVDVQKAETVDLSDQQSHKSDQPEEKSIVVKSKAEWDRMMGQKFEVKSKIVNDTQVDLEPGTICYVVPDPDGTWRSSPDHEPIGYKGYPEIPKNSNFKANGVNFFAMCSRVARDGTLTAIGEKPVVGAGRLYLLANDVNYPNNIGSIWVKLIVVRKPGK